MKSVMMPRSSGGAVIDDNAGEEMSVTRDRHRDR